MAYATVQQLADAASGGWQELAQRASHSGFVDGELLQLAATGADLSGFDAPLQAGAGAALVRLHDALERASRHADTFLFPRYRAALPLTPTLLAGSDLPSVVAAIALKRLYGTLVPEELRRSTQWADDYLTALSKGTASLGQLDTAVAPPARAPLVRTRARRTEWQGYGHA
jgi:phage gp36-like protein